VVLYNTLVILYNELVILYNTLVILYNELVILYNLMRSCLPTLLAQSNPVPSNANRFSNTGSLLHFTAVKLIYIYCYKKP